MACMNVSTTSVKNSSDKWIIVEKIIGFILLAWSVFVLYSVFSTIAGAYSSGYIKTGKTSFGSMAAGHHLIILVSILCLFGSCMLLYKDKTGWLLCVATSFFYGINLFISSRSKAIDDSLPFAKYYKSYGASALLFLIIFVLLLLNPIRKKYQPTLQTWIIIAALIAVMILDKILFNQ